MIAFQAKASFVCLLEVVRTTKNWWDALGILFGIRKAASVSLRHTSILFTLTKGRWGNYRLLTKVLLNRNVQYVGGGLFRHGQILFDYQSNGLGFFAYSSNMKCYRSSSKDILCEVDSLKFIVPFPYGTYELKEIFIDKIYGDPDCHDAVVVDVGAFIGDSSVFFASRGAKLVVAFEPIPDLYVILKKNVSLNGFESVIQTRNEAIGDVAGSVGVEYRTDGPGYSHVVAAGSGQILKISQIPLSKVIADLGSVDILKMDCEGCEHNALREAAAAGALKHVGLILIEVHFKLGNIIELLRAEGFDKIKLKQIGRGLWLASAQHESSRICSSQDARHG